MVKSKGLAVKIQQGILSFLSQKWCKWCGMVILVITLVIALIYIPEWQGEKLLVLTPEMDLQKAKQIDDYRATIAQIIGGFALIIGIYLTWRRIAAVERTVEVTEEGQITERFSRAIEHLGDDRMTVRLGGIYALERIATDSRKDHWAVVEVLLAYIRDHDHWEPTYDDDETTLWSQEFDWEILLAAKPLPTDVKAILSMLCKRKWVDLEEAPLRLNNTVLQAASLAGAYLVNADFSEANLAGLDFRGANLTGAKFTRAYLAAANFEGAILKGVSLSEANIEWANFTGADLQGSELDGSCCNHAHFSDTNLTDSCFNDARMKKVTIEDSCLEGVDLALTDLSDARIKGVNFSNLCLRYADLEGVDFEGVNLTGTDLIEAHLERADLSKSIGLTLEQIASAHIDENTILPPELKSNNTEN